MQANNKSRFSNLLLKVKAQYSWDLMYLVLAVILLTRGVASDLIYFLFVGLICVFLFQRFILSNHYAFFLIKVFLIVSIAFEFIIGKIPQEKKDAYEESFSENFFISTAIYGHEMEANKKNIAHRLIVNGDTIYNVLYCTDNNARRVSCSEMNQNRIPNRHAFFVGCSFTFGHGADFEATIPALYEKYSSNTIAVNLGCNGYGPHQNLMDLHQNFDNIASKNNIPSRGFMLYSFMDDHLNDVYADIKSSEIKFNQNGDWILTNKWNWRKFIIWLNNNSRSMQYFKVRIAHPQTQGYYRYFAGIINAMASEYHRYYPENTFYVGYYPGEVRDTAWIKYCKQNIKFIKTKPPYDLNENYYDYHLRYDLHPTIKLNDYYISYIHKNTQDN